MENRIPLLRIESGLTSCFRETMRFLCDFQLCFVIFWWILVIGKLNAVSDSKVTAIERYGTATQSVAIYNSKRRTFRFHFCPFVESAERNWIGAPSFADSADRLSTLTIAQLLLRIGHLCGRFTTYGNILRVQAKHLIIIT
jgi:hypothetical protein